MEHTAWDARLNRAIAYVEEHKGEHVDWSVAAGLANCSLFHFYRVFHALAGQTPQEYLRKRRLTMAATELADGSAKVVDVALRWGYDSPDAFARACKREFGANPSEIRSGGATIRGTMPLHLALVLKGDQPMEYRIESEPDLRLQGAAIQTTTEDGKNFREIPAFWQSIMKDGRFTVLDTNAKSGFHRNGGVTEGLGVVGVAYDFQFEQGRFAYAVAVEDTGVPLQVDGEVSVAVPAATYAKFACRGELPAAIQDTIKRVFEEWFPGSDYEHAGGPEMEIYRPSGDGNGEDYAEYWIPIVPKRS